MFQHDAGMPVRGHRVEAPRIALSFGPGGLLGESEKPEVAGSKARGRAIGIAGAVVNAAYEAGVNAQEASLAGSC